MSIAGPIPGKLNFCFKASAVWMPHEGEPKEEMLVVVETDH